MAVRRYGFHLGMLIIGSLRNEDGDADDDGKVQ